MAITLTIEMFGNSINLTNSWEQNAVLETLKKGALYAKDEDEKKVLTDVVQTIELAIIEYRELRI